MFYPSIDDVKSIIMIMEERHKINSTIINEGQLKFILDKPQIRVVLLV